MAMKFKWLFCGLFALSGLMCGVGMGFSITPVVTNSASPTVMQLADVKKVIMVKSSQNTIAFALQEYPGFTWVMSDYPSEFVQPESYHHQVQSPNKPNIVAKAMFVFKVSPIAFVMPTEIHIAFKSVKLNKIGHYVISIFTIRTQANTSNVKASTQK